MQDLAQQVLERAKAVGATAAECIVREGREFSVTVRLGEIETLKEAASKGLGLRVLLGRRAASCYTSDFSREGLERLVSEAVAIARFTSEDPAHGLPEPELLGQLPGDLRLYCDDVESLPVEERIEWARRAERAALDADPRIQNSEGASFEAAAGNLIFANSLGFLGQYRRSYCSLVAVPIAVADGCAMQRDYWYSVSRSLAGLEPPEQVGRIAAQRALRRLGARKAETCRVPVVFEPFTARGLLGDIFEAANGDSVYRQASFLANRLGQQIGSPLVTIIDDGTMPGGFGTAPFDDEGVPTRRKPIVEQGVLRNYLLNCYTGRKLNLPTTGNAARGLAGNPGIGHGNFYLLPGKESPEEIVRSIQRGFYVTECIGSGVNLVTGDYSRGAVGQWIENGEFAYPVEEVTIAGNLLEMFRRVERVGNDLEFRGSLACPTLMIAEMTLAGR
jgi:PmbA protein